MFVRRSRHVPRMLRRSCGRTYRSGSRTDRTVAGGANDDRRGHGTISCRGQHFYTVYKPLPLLTDILSFFFYNRSGEVVSDRVRSLRAERQCTVGPLPAQSGDLSAETAPRNRQERFTAG
ncbi:hypothetical protein J6590_034806 [Homalodisca vitripennis]|nr:hypothetical protein J6590_034806 [Homalodisca vitripennis]